MRPRLHLDDGVVSIEFVTLVPTLVAVGALVWQILLAGAAATAVENAARDGSRVAGRGADPAAVEAQVESSLPGWLSFDDVQVARPGGTEVVVTVPIPVMIPGVSNSSLTITRRAEMPATT